MRGRRKPHMLYAEKPPTLSCGWLFPKSAPSKTYACGGGLLFSLSVRNVGRLLSIVGL